MDRNSDIFLEIKWTINDIQELLKANNCDYSDEAIENFLKNILTKRNFGIIMCSQQRSKIVKVKKQSKPI